MVAGAVGSDGRKYANLSEFLNAFESKDKTKSDGAQLTQSECDGPKRRLIVPLAETATLNELFLKEVVLGVGTARRKQVSHLVEYPFTRNDPAAPGILAVDLDIKIDLAVFRVHARRAGWPDPGEPVVDGGATYLPHLICGRRHILPFVQAQMAELYRLLRYQDRDTVRVFVLQKKKAKRSADASAAVGRPGGADVFSDGIHMFLSVALPMAQHCWMYERMLKWIEGHWMNPRSPHFLPGLTTDARQILDKNVYAANTSVLKYGARKGGDTLVYALTALYEFQAYVSGDENEEDLVPHDAADDSGAGGGGLDWLDRVLPHRELEAAAAAAAAETDEQDDGGTVVSTGSARRRPRDDEDNAPPRRRRRSDSLGGSVAAASGSSSNVSFGPWRQTEEPVTSRMLHQLERRWFHLMSVRAVSEDVLVRPVRLAGALQAFVERDSRRFARRQATAEELRVVGGLDAKAVHRAQLADFTPDALLGGIQTTDDVLQFMQIFRASISPADEETPLLLNFVFHLPEEFYAKGHYGERLKVGFAMHSYSPKMLVAYLAFCAQREDFNFRTKVPLVIDKWRSFGGGRTTFRSIPFWCRASAPEAFDAIRVSTFETQIGLMLSTLTMGNVSNRKSATSGTDVDKARLLVRLAAGRFCCAAIKHGGVWYEYRDHRWEEIEEGFSVRIMVADDLYDMCHAHILRLNDVFRRLHDTEGAEAEVTKLAARRLEIALNIATSLKETRTIDNVFKEAKMRMYDKDFFRQLDDNGYLVCFANGVYDLREHVLREGQPDDFISKCTNYDYVPLEQQPPARVAAYKAYLKSMFPDPQTLEYVEDWIAFTFVADASINQCMHILSGTGKNGKSYLIELLRRAHGQRASYLKTSFYTEKTGGMGRASEELYNTINCSFVFSDEFSEGDVLYDDQMKQAVSGVTEMEARLMYKPLRRFIPKASMVVTTNHRPKIVGTDDGVWRRIRDLECVMYYTDNPDPRNPHQAKSRSAEQMAALLDDIYTVAASVSFARLKARAAACAARDELGYGKLVPCPAVVRATAAYRMEQDMVAAFLDDKTMSVACATVVPLIEVVNVFQNWCAAELGDAGAAKRKHNEMITRMSKRYSCTAPGVKPKGWFNLRIMYDDDNVPPTAAGGARGREQQQAFGTEEEEEEATDCRRQASRTAGAVLDDVPDDDDDE